MQDSYSRFKETASFKKHEQTVMKQRYDNEEVQQQDLGGFMGDLVHPYPATLATEIIQLGLQEELLRDEIYCQLIKQTSLNPSPDSKELGFKLMYLCLSTFPPTKAFKPYLLSHLAILTHPDLPKGLYPFDTVPNIVTNCYLVPRSLRRRKSHQLHWK